jgi:hypothetical protein
MFVVGGNITAGPGTAMLFDVIRILERWLQAASKSVCWLIHGGS